jgi:hypothetical protein
VLADREVAPIREAVLTDLRTIDVRYGRLLPSGWLEDLSGRLGGGGGAVVLNKGVRFRVHEVKCIDETNPEWPGSDEISWGGAAVDDKGTTSKIPEKKVGSGFDDGDRKIYSPPEIIKTFSLDNVYPKEFLVPNIITIKPSSVWVGSDETSITVDGSDFVSESVVRFNGSGRRTEFVSATQLTTSLSAADIATHGSIQVTVFNPPPVGLKPFVTKRVESVRAQLAREKQGYVIWTLAPPSVPPSTPSNTRLQQALVIKPTSFEAQYALVNAQTVAQTNDVIEPNGENLHITIHLKNGGVLEGQIIGSDENTITIQPYSGGVITISRNYIEEIKTYRLKVNDVLKKRAQALRPKAEAEIKVAPGPLNAGKVAGEILAGGLAGVGIGVVGGIIGVGIDMGLFDYYMEGLLGAFIGGSIGYTVGSPLGVYLIGSVGDETGSYLATLGGSILGFAAGVAGAIALDELLDEVAVITFFSGPLIGAVIGFNATQKKSSFEPGDALLNFNEGKMCLAVPSISLRLRHSELIQRVDLVKVGF